MFLSARSENSMGLVMNSNSRLDNIMKYIINAQRVEIPEISNTFGVSISTARRDLDELARHGYIQRTHGGALYIQKAPPELPIFQRQTEQADEKMRIGAAASELINEGETIFLGSGTTVCEICKHLDKFENLNIYTNSLSIINQLANKANISLFGLGGQFHMKEYLFYGYFVEKALSEIYVDKVFYGIRAISIDKGFTNDYLPEITTDRLILKSGKEVIMLADHTKFNRVSSTFVAPITIAQKIITDSATPENIISEIRQKGIEIIAV